MLPTRASRWVRLDESPMLPDDRAFEKMWGDKQGVHLLDLGDKARRKLSKGISFRHI